MLRKQKLLHRSSYGLCMPLYRKSSCVHYPCLLTSSWLFLLCTVEATAQLLEIKLHSAKLPLVSESFLSGELQRTSYLYICSGSTLRKMTLVGQYVQCCKTNGRCCWAAPTAYRRDSHSAGKLGKLLPQLPLISSLRGGFKPAVQALHSPVIL